MNERDSEIICALMMDEGYVPVSSYEEANLIIFNTCSVRKHAEDRVWGRLRELAPPKFAKANLNRGGTSPNTKTIGLVGCMGKAYGKEVFEKLPHVDFVCGPANIYDIPSLVKRTLSGEGHLLAIDRKERPLGSRVGPYRDEMVRAWVNISEGCNNSCSYCIVPYVRGREINRSIHDIVDEVKGLAANGTKEVTFLGQNVNSYRDGDMDFVDLLESTNSIKGLKRVRFMTSHPKDVGERLFAAMRRLDKVCEHLHLPLQSGSDKILGRMNRRYASLHYSELVYALRREIPGCAITTDIIVGFPGETEEDFYDTYNMMKGIGFDSAFVFKYSPRPFTEASKMKDDVPREVKEERNQILLSLQGEITYQKNKDLIGTVQRALGIRQAKRAPVSGDSSSAFYVKGRIRTNQQVVLRGDKSLIGEISAVKIKDIEQNTLIGELV